MDDGFRPHNHRYHTTDRRIISSSPATISFLFLFPMSNLQHVCTSINHARVRALSMRGGIKHSDVVFSAIPMGFILAFLHMDAAATFGFASSEGTNCFITVSSFTTPGAWVWAGGV